MDEKTNQTPKRLEELLLDDQERVPSDGVDHPQDIGIGADKQRRYRSSMIAFAIFFLLMIGGGYLYLQTLPTSQPQLQPHNYVSPRIAIPARPVPAVPIATGESAVDEVHGGQAAVGDAEKETIARKAQVPEAVEKEKNTSSAAPSTDLPETLFTVSVGPLLSKTEIARAEAQLRELGFQAEKSRERGMVTMIRLREGTYPVKVAREHLRALKKLTESAFLLPHGTQLSVFAGSFHMAEEADKLQDELAKEGVLVIPVDARVEMTGTFLAALQADQKTAREVADHLSSLGLETTVAKVK